MTADPTETDPSVYRVVFENDRVRVLDYQDQPGSRTQPHSHPDSVMYTLSDFTRTLGGGGREADVTFSAGSVRWLSAQEHYGEHIGTSGNQAPLSS